MFVIPSSATVARHTYVLMLLPNLGIGAAESTWSIFHVIPVAADQTVVETRTRVTPVSDWQFLKQSVSSWWHWKGKSKAKFDGSDDDPLLSGDFMAEDVFVCEQQFKAMHWPMFSVGATAKTLERSILVFQEHVLRLLSEAA
ncbi:MAG: SRPBCC family protein [Rhodopirellula sp. JB053]